MTWAAALSVAILSWLPFGHMHVEPAAELSSATITDMREWFGNQGVAVGLIVGGRELCDS